MGAHVYEMSYLFIILAKNDIKTKENKRNYSNFVLYYQIIRIAYLCVKTENIIFLLHFMKVKKNIRKRLKNCQNFVLWLP